MEKTAADNGWQPIMTDAAASAAKRDADMKPMIGVWALSGTLAGLAGAVPVARGHAGQPTEGVG